MLSRTGHRADVLAALSAPLLVVAVLAGLLCARPVDEAVTARGVDVAVAVGGLVVTGLSVLLVMRRTVDRRRPPDGGDLEPSQTTRVGATPDGADLVLGAVATAGGGDGSPVVVRRRDLRPPKRAPWWSRRRRAGGARTSRPGAPPSPTGSGPSVPAAWPEPSPPAPPVQPLGHFTRDDAVPATGAATRPAPPTDTSHQSRHTAEPDPGRAPGTLPVSSGQSQRPAYGPVTTACRTQRPEFAPDGPSAPPSPTPLAVPTQSRRPVRSAADVPPDQPAMITTFTPQPTSGTVDDAVTTLLAQRADLAQQALSELSQLSAYRPAATPRGGGAADPIAAEGAPAEAVDVPGAGRRPERDAQQVRSLLSSVTQATAGPDRPARPVAGQRPGE